MAADCFEGRSNPSGNDQPRDARRARADHTSGRSFEVRPIEMAMRVDIRIQRAFLLVRNLLAPSIREKCHAREGHGRSPFFLMPLLIIEQHPALRLREVEKCGDAGEAVDFRGIGPARRISRKRIVVAALERGRAVRRSMRAAVRAPRRHRRRRRISGRHATSRR
jgi:hypothetical protein